MSKNIIFNYNLESYNKKYRNNRYKLLSFSKKEIEDFNKKKKNKNVDFLLKSRKWALIGGTYYEIPKAPRWTWFRNLNAGVQATVISLGSVGLVSAAVFPVLCETIWKPVTAGVSEKVKEYVEIETKEKLEIGKEATIILTVKEDKKDEAQLPKDPNQITVTTGGVKLPYYDDTSSVTNTVRNSKCSSYSDSIVSNDSEEEPDNYFTYTFSKDKAGIWIKKVLGPIVVDMKLDDRTYTVTYNPRNEKDETTSIEVKRGETIKSEEIRQIENNDYRTFTHWYLGDKVFDFTKQIYEDKNLTAHYSSGSKTGIYIKGLTGTKDQYYATADAAHTAGIEKMPGIRETISLEKFKNTFNDYRVINYNGKERYLANLSWYVFGEMNITNTNDYYYLSFGRPYKNLGENLDFYNTNLIGVTEGSKVSNNLRFCILKGSEQDALENPFNVENIEIALPGDFVFTCQDEGSHFVFNMKDCKMDNTLYIDQGYKMTLNIENNTFDFSSNSEYCCQLIRSDVEVIEGKAKDDTIIFKNNYFNGAKMKKCLNFNDPFCGNGIVKNNTFKDVHTNGEGKVGQSVIQFSQGAKYEVSDNTFTNCKCNTFMIHGDVAEYTKDMQLIINNNTIKGFKDGSEICSYVGVIEPDLDSIDFTYHLTSSGNTITDTYTDKCGLDEEVISSTGPLAKHIFYINKNVNVA